MARAESRQPDIGLSPTRAGQIEITDSLVVLLLVTASRYTFVVRVSLRRRVGWAAVLVIVFIRYTSECRGQAPSLSALCHAAVLLTSGSVAIVMSAVSGILRAANLCSQTHGAYDPTRL